MLAVRVKPSFAKKETDPIQEEAKKAAHTLLGQDDKNDGESEKDDYFSDE